MEVQYLGHSSFKIKGKDGVVITDPYASSVGFPFPSNKADVVTISHHHADHDNILPIKPAGERKNVFVIDQAGEYEVGGITVFGYPTFHDSANGAERGKNIIYSIYVDDVHILHLGDLGHTLTEKQTEEITDVDILLCPVGGTFSLDPQQAVDVIAALEPRMIVPMHYRTPRHDAGEFGQLATLEEFMTKFGKTVTPQEKLVVSAVKSTSEDAVETQLIVLEPKNV